MAQPNGALRLRLLSFNIHVGLGLRHPAHYLTRAWRHVLPGFDSRHSLNRIAEAMQGYDFVAIQEADAGSWRTRQLNLIEYLARYAGYPYWGHTVTRDLRPFARHSLGYLSRHAPVQMQSHVLPSAIPGRGAITVDLGATAGGLHLVVTHLSLGHGSRMRQLDYLSARVPSGRPVVLLGDLNCDLESLRRHEGLRRSGLWLPDASPATFPSWKPLRSLSHVIPSSGIDIHRIEALPHRLSDHLALAVEIGVRAP